MLYTLISLQNQKIQLNDAEYKGILSSLQAGKKMFYLQRTGEMITLNPPPTIVLSERFEQNERERLMNQGRWKCEKETIHRIGDQCLCWQHGGYLLDPIKAEEEFQALPEPEKQKAEQKVTEYQKIKNHFLYEKKMVEPSYEEQLQARADGGEKRAKAILNNSVKI